MKAMLVEKGFPLYEQIWSDHPPLFTYLLAMGFRFVGYKVGFSRYIVLFFSVLLVWSGGRILRLLWDEKIALMGQVLILFLNGFFFYSNAVMIGMPSVALAVFSLWTLLEWYHNRKAYWLIFSGLFLVSSVLTKIFLGFLALVFAIGLLISEYYFVGKRLKLSIIFPLLVFGLSFLLPLIFAIFVWIGVENLDQLLSMHSMAVQLEEFQGRSINKLLIGSLGYCVLAIVGVIDVIKNKKWMALYIITWAILAYIFLLNIAPVWDHHHFYVTIPLALMAAPLAYKILCRFWVIYKKEHQDKFTAIFQVTLLLFFLTIFFSFRLPSFVQQLEPIWIVSEDELIEFSDIRILAEMSEYKDQTNWVVTDLPMYAFRNQLLVPPEIANFSYKRLATGNITISELISVIENYHPEQILIGRHDLPELIDYIEEDYLRIYNADQKALYIRKDLLKEPIGFTFFQMMKMQ